MISCNAEQIKARLLEFCTLMRFEFHGLDCSIDPFNPADFHLACNDVETDVNSIDEVMTIPFFGGKCLNDISDEIEILEW